MVVLTMNIVYLSLGVKPALVAIRIPGTPGHALLRFDGKYYDPTNLETYTKDNVDILRVWQYDDAIRLTTHRYKQVDQ